MSKKNDFVPKTFTDAGTGETFEGGKEHGFEAGAHANYKAAGLVGKPDEQQPKSETASKSRADA